MVFKNVENVKRVCSFIRQVRVHVRSFIQNIRVAEFSYISYESWRFPLLSGKFRPEKIEKSNNYRQRPLFHIHWYDSLLVLLTMNWFINRVMPWEGWTLACPEFKELSYNPISTKGLDYAHHITACPSRFENLIASLWHTRKLRLRKLNIKWYIC